MKQLIVLLLTLTASAENVSAATPPIIGGNFQAKMPIANKIYCTNYPEANGYGEYSVTTFCQRTGTPVYPMDSNWKFDPSAYETTDKLVTELQSGGANNFQDVTGIAYLTAFANVDQTFGDLLAGAGCSWNKVNRIVSGGISVNSATGVAVSLGAGIFIEGPADTATVVKTVLAGEAYQSGIMGQTNWFYAVLAKINNTANPANSFWTGSSASAVSRLDASCPHGFPRYTP